MILPIGALHDNDRRGGMDIEDLDALNNELRRWRLTKVVAQGLHRRGVLLFRPSSHVSSFNRTEEGDRCFHV